MPPRNRKPRSRRAQAENWADEGVQAHPPDMLPLVAAVAVVALIATDLHEILNRRSR
jgi:hypothetical protein